MAKNTYYVIFENSPSGDGTTQDNSPVARNPTINAPQENDEVFNSVRKYASLAYAGKIANKVVSHRINTIELRTGKAELQQRLQASYEIVNTGVDIGKNIIVGGLIGGGVGAVVGAVAGVAESLFDLSLRQEEISMKRRSEDITIHYNRIRAGASQDRTGQTR